MNNSRIVMLGTFDPEFGRNRQWMRLADERGLRMEVRNFPLWGDDKVNAATTGIFGTLVRALSVYTRIVWSVIRTAVPRSRRPLAILIPHPSQVDAIVIGLLARVVRIPVIIDYFISLHETVITDRGLGTDRSIKARTLRFCDRWAARLASVVITDTPEDLAEFSARSRTDPSKWRVVRVGADPTVFRPWPGVEPEPGTVLFYGTYIPLQGIEHIVRASLLLPHDCSLTLVGNGQLRSSIERLISELSAPVTLVDQVAESELGRLIARAEICLGVFGGGAKTQRVIPNKVYQCMAVGRPVITCTSPAVAVLGDAVLTVPPADPVAIADAVRVLNEDPVRREALAQRGLQMFMSSFSDERLREDLAEVVSSLRMSPQMARRMRGLV